MKLSIENLLFICNPDLPRISVTMKLISIIKYNYNNNNNNNGRSASRTEDTSVRLVL
jgi:hypothetical protein